VGKEGNQAGPFALDAMGAYIAKGAITRETLVWKTGMPGWEPAGQLPELAALLSSMPPPLPR